MQYRLEHDPDTESPRDWDNLGTMLCYHRRYTLGDIKESKEISSERAAEIYESEDFISLPVFMYEHSGIALSTGRGYPFNDPWDSGQLGIIFVSKAKVRHEYSCKRITAKIRQRVIDCLISEVETYSAYVSGDTWYFVIEDENGEVLDSCGGFIGYDYAEESAKEALAYLEKSHIENDQEAESYMAL